MSEKPKKQEIYEAAAKLFQEKGYKAASMRDLADRVNLRASSLYSHIRKKEEILQKICCDQAARFTRMMDKVEKMDASPLEKVRTLLSFHIRTALEDPTSIILFSDEWEHLEDPCHSRLMLSRRDYEQRFRCIIQAGILMEEFPALDPYIILYTLLSGVHWLHRKRRLPTPQRTEVLEREVLELLLGGLGKKVDPEEDWVEFEKLQRNFSNSALK